MTQIIEDITSKVSESPREYSQRILKEAAMLYKSESYKNEVPTFCDIHKVFQEKLGEKSHSCVACNLADISEMLLNSLNAFQIVKTELEAFSAFLINAYLLVERMEEVFRIIKLPDYYEHKHFAVFKTIRQWMNFIKHPKAFMFVHHPSFYFEDEVTVNAKDVIVINNDFIKEYYSSTEKNSKLYSLLVNKQKVVVLFPPLAQLLNAFIDAQKMFINIISNNEVFRELLTTKSVIENYFDASGEQSK